MNAAMNLMNHPARAQRPSEVRPVYLEALTLVERLHRRLLDVRPNALDRADFDSAEARVVEFRQRFLAGQTVLFAHAEFTAAGEAVLRDCARSVS